MLIKSYDMQKDIDFYYKKSRLNQLRGFCAVVQNQASIAKAAKKSNLEPATISKQIRTLENDLGTPLFDRSGYNKLKITPEGQLFYDDVIKYINGIDGIFDNFNKNLENYRNNNLRIASSDTILERMLPYLHELKQKYPKVNISLFNIPKTEAYEMLVSKQLDLGFYLEDVYEELPIELEKDKLSDHKSYWVMSKNHPLANKNEKDITKDDLAKYPFGIFEELVFTKSFKFLIEECNLKSPINIKNPTIGLLIKMAKTGFSISSISEILLNETDKKELELKTDYILSQRYFYRFVKKNATQSKVSDEFSKIVKQNHEKIFH